MAVATLSQADAATMRAQLDRDPAPSVQVQTEQAILRGIMDYMGGASVVSSRRIPLNHRYDMRSDAIIAYAHLIALSSQVSAKWRMRSSSALKAEFNDKVLRRIYGRLVIQCAEARFFGWQALVKETEDLNPDWEYIERGPDGEKTVKKVWDEGSIPAKVWAPFVPLRPETVQPHWGKEGALKGKFNGIELGEVGPWAFHTTPFLQVIDGNSQEKDLVPLENSLWVINNRDGNFGCSPYDELVLTAQHGYVPIGKLDPEEHKLISWDRCQHKIRRGGRNRPFGGYSFEKGVRPYEGDLLTIATDKSRTRVTPNHKLSVRWNTEAAENKYAVYLMRKGDWWRIGMTRMHKGGGHADSGIRNRMYNEKADCAWMLGAFDTKREALFNEHLWSAGYAIPELTFLQCNGQLDTGDLEEIWSSIDSSTGARRLLEDLRLAEEFPLYSNSRDSVRKHQAGKAPWTIAAANLVPELMEIPVDPGSGRDEEWLSFTITREHFEGDVYSLEIDPYHHYISGGAIVQNSVWGSPRTETVYKYWRAYEALLAVINTAVQRKGDPLWLILYPTGSSIWNDVETPNQTIAKQLAQSARSGAVLTMPSEMYDKEESGSGSSRKWEIVSVKFEDNLDKLMDYAKYLDVMKFRGMFISELSMSEGSGGTSSRNVAAVTGAKSDALQYPSQLELDDQINRYMIPQISDTNFPELSHIPCEKETLSFGEGDAALAADLIKSLANANPMALPMDVKATLEKLNIDTSDPQSALEAEKRMIEAAKNDKPPPTESKSGQAGVEEETGFYVQEREHIYLDAQVSRGDETLINSLPPTRHFQDQAVVDQMRLVRSLWHSLLSEQYEDFARHIEKGEADVGEVDLAEGDEKKRVKKIVDKVVASWKFDSKRVAKAVSKTKDALSSIFSRAGEVETKAAGLSTDGWRPDEAKLAKWVADNTGVLIKSVEKTTKDQLKTYLEDAFKGDKTAKQIADGIRSHFSEFPSWRADLIARTETSRLYCAATLFAAEAQGKTVQALDARLGDHRSDKTCIDRNGRLMDLPAAWRALEDEHPRGTLAYKIVRTDLAVEYVTEEQQPEVAARTDRERGVVYLRDDLSAEDEGRYLIQAVEWVEATSPT